MQRTLVFMLKMFSLTAKFMTAQPIGKLQTIMSKSNL